MQNRSGKVCSVKYSFLQTTGRKWRRVNEHHAVRGVNRQSWMEIPRWIRLCKQSIIEKAPLTRSISQEADRANDVKLALLHPKSI